MQFKKKLYFPALIEILKKSVLEIYKKSNQKKSDPLVTDPLE